MFDSLQPCELQHTRLPCPSLSARICSNSCPSSWWCYPTISSSAAPFSFCFQSFPAFGSFPKSWQESLRINGVALIVNKSPKFSTWVQSQKWQNDLCFSVRFWGKPFNIRVIQVYALTTNAEEAEVEWFYEDLQDLLAAAAKSLQLCSTLCDPIDGSPPGSSGAQDSPGKITGVGCHFLLQCIKVKSESEVAQSCPTPSDPMDCSLRGSSVHGIFQARGYLFLMSVFISISKLQIFRWHTTWQSNSYFVCTLCNLVWNCASWSPKPLKCLLQFLREQCSVTFGSVYKWKAMQPE